MKTLILVICILLATHTLFSSDWEKLNVMPDFNNLYSVSALSEDTIAACGETGTIKISYDKGQSWNYTALPTFYKLLSMAFIDNSTIITCGEKGIIFRSSDCGKTWEQVQLNTSEDLNSIAAGSNSDCLIVGKNGLILKSYNNGLDFSLQSSSYIDDLIKIKHFSTDSYVAIGANGCVLLTTDKGNTWTKSNTGSNYNLYDVDVIDDNIIVAVGVDLSFIRSEDCGKTWKRTFMCASSDKYTSKSYLFKFINSNVGLSFVINNGCTYSTKNYFTNDGGASWATYGDKDLISVTNYCFFDSTNGYIVAHSGGTGPISINTIKSGGSSSIDIHYLKLKEKFYTWAIMGRSLSSINQKVGVINEFGELNRAYISTDYGTQWKIIKEDSYRGDDKTFNYRKICFPSENTIIIVADSEKYFSEGNRVWTDNYPVIMTSKDNGETWNNFLYSKKGNAFSISFANENLGIISLTEKMGNPLLLTTDGGFNWNELPMPDSNYMCLYAQFINPNNLKCIMRYSGIGYVISETTDLGKTWNTNFNKIPLYYWYFIDENVGWLCGGENRRHTIYKTTDRGINWNKQLDFLDPEYTGSLNSIAFYNSQNGVAGGDGGIMQFTSDGGNSWTRDRIKNFGLYENVVDVSYNTEDYVFVLGHQSSVFRKRLSPTDVNENISERNKSMIYPNPADDKIYLSINPKLNINNFKVSIFNFLGNNLISKSFSNKESKAELNIESLTTGTYLLVIDYGNIRESKLFVKMK